MKSQKSGDSSQQERPNSQRCCPHQWHKRHLPLSQVSSSSAHAAPAGDLAILFPWHLTFSWRLQEYGLYP